MGIIDFKISTFTDNIKNLPDYPSDSGITADQLKALFDGRTDKEVKNSINGIIDCIVENGAEFCGASVAGLSGNTVLSLLEAVKTLLDTKVATADIADGLTFSDADKPLSAKQGKILKELIENIDKYTRAEVDNKFSAMETNIDWKESVATYEDIATTYPNPADGWTVNVGDTDYTYRFNGSFWVAISANAIPKSTSLVDGLMTKEDKVKLSGIETDANKTTVVDDLTSGGSGYALSAEQGKILQGSKANVTTFVTDTTTGAKTISSLADNTAYQFNNAITSLTISAYGANFKSCSIDFSSGAVPAVINFSALTSPALKISGTDVSSNTFSPAASKRYNLVFFHDGVNVVVSVSGYSI